MEKAEEKPKSLIEEIKPLIANRKSLIEDPKSLITPQKSLIKLKYNHPTPQPK